MKQTIFKSFALSLAIFLLMNSALATEIPAAIKKRLDIVVPGYDASSVKATPISGLYEFIGDGRVLYISQDGRYIVDGSIIDLEDKINLTEKTKNNVTRQLIEGYDEKKMIVFPAEGKTRHTITVFTDVDCPYCAMLHKEVPKLNKAGVTVRYLMYPRAGPGSPTFIKSVSVWCAVDQKKALGMAKEGSALEAKTCDNPVLEQFELGQKIGVTGTPTLILENGKILPGFIPADQLIKLLDHQG
ncbi:MAG TPA: DsbC family protein [Gammaproteobacteria bacterium]|nr:thiol:disulfide interchange protein DsbC precursor [bacterium BMS3Abin11]HDH15695.1 DsbC family protein [Gammaproteobacteria bacterium]